jgi:hypothetical protein
MKSVAYQFSILRYVHDTVTQEFVNVGVAVYAPGVGFLRTRCTENYARISRMFLKIDGAQYRQIVHYIESQVSAREKRFDCSFQFEPPPTLDTVLREILPRDDSAFRFSEVGVGTTGDPRRALDDLYRRHVEQYLASERPTRDDEEVWRVFREPLDRKNITPLLRPKRIVAPLFEYEFKRAWRNGVWHLYEPVSFDLVEEYSVLDKANRWLGRGENLSESDEPFRMYLLLGEPRDSTMRSSFRKARSILNKIPVQKEFILESERDAFADELAQEIEEHES